jgi:hypothetical protein
MGLALLLLLEGPGIESIGRGGDAGQDGEDKESRLGGVLFMGDVSVCRAMWDGTIAAHHRWGTMFQQALRLRDACVVSPAPARLWSAPRTRLGLAANANELWGGGPASWGASGPR